MVWAVLHPKFRTSWNWDCCWQNPFLVLLQGRKIGFFLVTMSWQGK